MDFEEFKKARHQAVEVIKDAKELIPSLEHYETDFSEPLKFAVLSSFSTGKSTFLNAIVFENNILHADSGETTRGIFKICYGENICYKLNGSEKQCVADLEGLKSLIEEHNEKAKNEKKSFLAEIKVNLPKLKDLVVFDVPGFGGLDEEQLTNIISEACQSLVSHKFFWIFL